MWGDLISAGASLFQGSQNRESQERIAAQNIAAQREFAQQGIRWKVADANAAGIHPLFAMGANTTSFSPVSVGTDNSIAEAGQSIGRAVNAAVSSDEKAKAQTNELAKLTLEKAGLENDVLRAELASKVRAISSRTAGNGPGIPPATPAGDMPLGWARMVGGGPQRTFGGHAMKDDDIKQKPESDFPVKTLRFAGLPIDFPSWMSSGQDWEDAAGEAAGSFMSAFNVPAAVLNTVYDRVVKPAYESFPARNGRAAARRRQSRPWGE